MDEIIAAEVSLVPTGELRVIESLDGHMGLLDTGAAGPLVLHGVQHVIHPPAHLDAWPDDDRASRIVLIVRDIAKADVEASIAAFERTARAPVRAAAGRP